MNAVPETSNAVCQIDLGIGGMTCASCVSRVERALKKVDGVVSAVVNLASERATLTYVPGLVARGDLVKAVEAAGYQQVRIVGRGDIADICRLTCLEHGIEVVTDKDVPTLQVEGFKVQLRMEEK